MEGKADPDRALRDAACGHISTCPRGVHYSLAPARFRAHATCSPLTTRTVFCAPQGHGLFWSGEMCAGSAAPCRIFHAARLAPRSSSDAAPTLCSFPSAAPPAAPPAPQLPQASPHTAPHTLLPTLLPTACPLACPMTLHEREVTQHGESRDPDRGDTLAVTLDCVWLTFLQLYLSVKTFSHTRNTRWRSGKTARLSFSSLSRGDSSLH